MKRNTLLTAATLFAGSLLSAQAGPKDDVASSIKMLTEKGNYSWTSTSKRPEGADAGGGRFGGGATNGKTADGLILLSRVRGDRTFETLSKGEKMAVKRDDAWNVLEPRPARDAGAEGQGQRRGRGTRGGFGRSVSAPASQAAELLEKVAELKKDGDSYVGDLTEEGAKSLVSFGGGRRGGADNADRPAPTGVKASAKFWVSDGVLTKYETSVAGKITFNGNERDLSRISTVEIKDVGSTKIEVPEDTKKQLDGAAKKEEATPEKKEAALEKAESK